MIASNTNLMKDISHKGVLFERSRKENKELTQSRVLVTEELGVVRLKLSAVEKLCTSQKDLHSSLEVIDTLS